MCDTNKAVPTVPTVSTAYAVSAIPAMPPPGEIRNKRQKTRGRGLRRAEEDVPGTDYLERMERLGSRDGESHLAFRMRMAQIKEGRRVLIEAGRRCFGTMSDVCRELGISKHNLTRHLHHCGLTPKDIADFRVDAGYRQ